MFRQSVGGVLNGKLFLLILTLLITLLAACQLPAEDKRPLTPTIQSRTVEESSRVIDLITPTPDPTRLPTLTPLTVQPSRIPKQMITVAVPERWTSIVLEAFAKLNAADRTWQWQLVEKEANIDLLAGDHGQHFASTYTALTVDFSSELESITIEEASAILDHGDERVVAMEWTEVPSNRKTLKIDGLMPGDHLYSLHQPWSLTSAPDYEAAAFELLSAMKTAFQEDTIVELAAVGDIMLDRALGYAIEQGNVNYPFALVADVLSPADITIGNFESALGPSGEPANKSYTFRAPPASAESLSLAGFDLVSLANNHALDYGTDALIEGISLLKEQGIHTIGAGNNRAEAHKPVILEVNDLRIAFLGYVDVPVEFSGFDTKSWQATGNSAGLAWANRDDILDDVMAADQQADLVIIALHSGYEYVETPSEPQRTAARSAIDAGADLVIGHHAHVLQGIEFYNGGVIAYGLGNFAFEIDGDPSTAVLKVLLDRNGVREIEILPAIIQYGGQTRMASAGEAAVIKNRVYYLSELLERD